MEKKKKKKTKKKKRGRSVLWDAGGKLSLLFSLKKVKPSLGTATFPNPQPSTTLDSLLYTDNFPFKEASVMSRNQDVAWQHSWVNPRMLDLKQRLTKILH